MKFKDYAVLTVIGISALVSGCKSEGESNHTTRNELAKAIQNEIPKAVPFKAYADSLFFFLYTVHNIPENQILIG
jgi:hypothetical protein